MIKVNVIGPKELTFEQVIGSPEGSVFICNKSIQCLFIRVGTYYGGSGSVLVINTDQKSIGTAHHGSDRFDLFRVDPVYCDCKYIQVNNDQINIEINVNQLTVAETKTNLVKLGTVYKDKCVYGLAYCLDSTDLASEIISETFTSKQSAQDYKTYFPLRIVKLIPVEL
jgi:hypothetical protein